MAENQNQNSHHPEKKNGNGVENCDNENEKDGEPVIPEELLNEIPPNQRKEFIQSFTRISGVFQQPNPLLKKITSDHITDLIKNHHEADQRDREERQGERNYNFKILITVLLTILILCGGFIYAKQEEFLKYIIGAIIGFGGGFGVGKHYKKE